MINKLVCSLGLVQTYMGIYLNRDFPHSFLKVQKHTVKYCHKYAKPTGGDITLTVKPCWPIRSLKKVTTGFDRITTMAH